MVDMIFEDVDCRFTGLGVTLDRRSLDKYIIYINL